MASRRTTKKPKTTTTTTVNNNNKNYARLKITDVLCPVCRGVLIEPVSLPCNHAFCYVCFDGTMQNANLVCPLCRIRVGSWLRRAKKGGQLVDEKLWDFMRNKFAEQIKNKLEGIEEDFEEEPKVIVACQGEIRKEYEVQKVQVEEELRKRQEAEMKASEELIEKIKAEERQKQLEMEEKLKIDEEVARKLAEELTLSQPSTSKAKNGFKTPISGPMDKFLTPKSSENKIIDLNKPGPSKSPVLTRHFVKETKPSPQLIKPMEDFVNKNYTCTVLRMDRESPKPSTLVTVNKRLQLVQKVLESENNSDSNSDCFESEMWYFKPIDYRKCPKTQGKPPIKILPKKPLKKVAGKISSPTGLINFFSNVFDSAFVKLPGESQMECGSKRDLSDDPVEVPPKKLKLEEIPMEECTDEDEEKRKLQEKLDFEFARKLQNELNKSVHNLRSSNGNRAKRQTTLDEILNNSHRLNA